MNILFIHRVRLVLSGDAGLALLGKNLAAASAGELLSDFGWAVLRLLRGGGCETGRRTLARGPQNDPQGAPAALGRGPRSWSSWKRSESTATSTLSRSTASRKISSCFSNAATRASPWCYHRARFERRSWPHGTSMCGGAHLNQRVHARPEPQWRGPPAQVRFEPISHPLLADHEGIRRHGNGHGAGGVSISDLRDTDTRIHETCHVSPPRPRLAGRRLVWSLHRTLSLPCHCPPPHPDAASSALRLTSRILHARGVAVLPAPARLRNDPNPLATRATSIRTSAIRNLACLYLYVSWSTYRQHSN
jgi:hypothetical protein